MLQVGSLGARWVLMQHADPWLLTVKSKPRSQPSSTSERFPCLANKHNNPFMRKRCRRGVPRETEEPPAKKSALNKQDGENREDAERLAGEMTIEKQKERADEVSGDKLLNLEEEEGKQKQPEEEGERQAGKEKMETEDRPEKKELRDREESIDDERDEEPCSSPTGSGDA